jgi:hypothetical protein
LFISAGMIVGFDNDDADIFDEQYQFLQKAQIPTVMLSVLLAVPSTPLYKRLQAEGRLRTARTTGRDASEYVGTSGSINFEPLHMTREEVEQGQRRLYQRLYSPEAFASRLLGNLGRFRDVHFRPERLRYDNLITFFRLAWHYARQGKAARKFFWSILRKTLWHSPRSFAQMVVHLGMYDHFCKVHGERMGWNPWRSEAAASDANEARERIPEGAGTLACGPLEGVG